jgi:hypothetical protein
MKKNLFLATLVSLFLFAATASAQKSGAYSGTWVLDVAKSKLGERNMIESETLTVTQTDKDIKFSRSVKRTPPSQGAPGGGAPGAGGPPAGGGGRGPGGGMGAPMEFTYTLDGKESTMNAPGPGGATVPVKMLGKTEAGKIMLETTRTFNTPQGEMTQVTKETWSLSADGNTLTVDRHSSSQRGSASTTSVYTKKQ